MSRALSPPRRSTAAEAIASLGTVLIATLVLAFVAGYFNTVLSAASVAAVSQYYVEGKIDLGYCLRRAWYRIASLSAVYVVFALALVGAGVLIFVLIGIPLFFYLLVVWFFFVECIMLERKEAAGLALAKQGPCPGQLLAGLPDWPRVHPPGGGHQHCG